MKRSSHAKVVGVVLSVLLLGVMLVAFAACNDTDSDKDTAITVTIGSTVYEVSTTDEASLHDVLKKLSEKHGFSYSFSESAMGLYITSIADLAPSATQWIAVYHDIDDITLYDVAYPDEKVVGGVTYRSSFVNVALLPIKSGAHYMLTVNEIW